MLDEQQEIIPPDSAKELPVISTNTNSPKEIQTPIEKISDRNRDLLKKYSSGVSVDVLAQEFKITQTRCYQIINRHKNLVEIDKQVEKVRRYNRLRKVEKNASKDLAPKDAKELVAVLEAQRKELEGDSQGTTNNTQINISIDKIQIANLSDGDKLSKLRELLGG